MSSFSLTSTLVQKLACYFLDKDTCQGKTCLGRYLPVEPSALVKENLSYFSFTLPRKTCQGKTCQGKTCQGELSSVYSQQVFLRLVKENLLGFILMQISRLGIQQFSPAVLKEDFEATIAVLPVQFSVLLCSRIQYIVSSVLQWSL